MNNPEKHTMGSAFRQQDPDFILQFLRDLPPSDRARARRLVLMLERMAAKRAQENRHTAPHVRNWQGLDLAGTFLKSAADVRFEKRMMRVMRQLKQISPDKAVEVIAHYLHPETPAAPPTRPARKS